jgi:REP element-mobilizing transposase RayT
MKFWRRNPLPVGFFLSLRGYLAALRGGQKAFPILTISIGKQRKQRSENRVYASRMKRKLARHFEEGKPVHLVIKCERPIYQEAKFVYDLFFRIAGKTGQSHHDIAVAMDHIHLKITIHSRAIYRKFIRAFTGQLARKFGKGLIQSVFTRIVSWGRDFSGLIIYFMKNREEARREFKSGSKFRYERKGPNFKHRWS